MNTWGMNLNMWGLLLYSACDIVVRALVNACACIALQTNTSCVVLNRMNVLRNNPVHWLLCSLQDQAMQRIAHKQLCLNIKYSH